ncbi:carbohydrate esterase family 10 protein [Ceratobasidium sp. AG-Ba]|nr:carbohydrate esterase family 10 protein [Ceratobasidium sp. AG-Ba]QRV98884.1 carbohydrate esterase family 10 protein [Ceratobasidium sp. AG-Ba]
MPRSHPRDHPLSKGSCPVEGSPANPSVRSSLIIAAGAIGLGALSYLAHGFVTATFSPSPPQFLINPARHNTAPVVNLGYASYRGLINDTVPEVVSFLGVPYARPPRRFRAPQSLDEAHKEHEIEDKQIYPDPCVQGWSPWLGLDDRGGAGTENCLMVNIYTPRTFTNTTSYPVLVYMHGGGFHAGNPEIWPFDNWVQRSPTPFVAVSIYYRLSAMGFLASPDPPGKGVHAGPDPELLVNAGLHDQRMALKFVQKHIHAFGGDPNRVTIMGQSAGAASVGSHLVAKFQEPEDKLFHRAILQSWYRPPLSQPADREQAWIHLAKSVGCYYKTWSTQNVLECLREVDAVKLMQAADEGMARHPQDENWTWRPLLDGTLFPDYPATLLRETTDLDVDIIVGHTTHDAVAAGSGFSSFVTSSWPRLSSVDAQQLEEMYLEAGIPPEDIVEFGIGEGCFRCASYVAGSVYGDRVYSYRFDEPDPVNLKKAGHSADNWILFEGTRNSPNGTNTFNPLTPAQRALSDETISYIVAFVATGDPNSPLSLFTDTASPPKPVWPSYTSGKRMVFRAESGGTNTRGQEGGSYVEDFDLDEVERCRVWQSFEEKMGV